MIKYTKNEHFENLLSIGSIRIGTLKDYKEGDHGDMVSDSMEGSKKFSGQYSELTSESIKKSSALSSLISLGDGGSIRNLNMTNITIIEPDFYIFSLAENYFKDDHLMWLQKESYDVAYEIEYSKTFFRRITNELNLQNPVRFLGLFYVHYYDECNGMDFFDSKNGYPAFCLKGSADFSNQKEIRAVWQPIGRGDITPVNLKVKGLGHYVTLKENINKYDIKERVNLDS